MYEWSAAHAATEGGPSSTPAAARPRVLVIDDRAASRRLLADTLMDDYEVITADSGAYGLHVAQLEPLPDLILLDVMMPGMDGYEVCHRLKSDVRTQGIPVIFVTNRDSEDDEKQGIDLGAVDYISHPFSSAILLARVRAHVQARRQALVFEQMALLDGLTGLSNRRHLGIALAREWERARRSSEPVGLLFVDIDHLKHINDSRGHVLGDEVVRRVAELLVRASRRPCDLAARYGGDELVLLMPNTDLAGTVAVAEKLRGDVERDTGGDEEVTISAGCDSRVPSLGEDASVVVTSADRQLYRAKSRRNCVCWPGSPDDVHAMPSPSRLAGHAG